MQPLTNTVFLVRHGRTALNAAGALRGRVDVPLDAVGRAEAAGLGELFAGTVLDFVATSPLQRARDTAAPMALRTGARLRVEPRLVDRDYGPWNGRSAADLHARFGSIAAAPGVEAEAAFHRRVLAAFEALTAAAGGPIVIVAHEAVNRALLGRIVSQGATARQRPGCWNRLERGPDAWSAPVLDALPGDGRSP
ncbi:histidine phosphatase family protein [soil metagenome]